MSLQYQIKLIQQYIRQLKPRNSSAMLNVNKGNINFKQIRKKVIQYSDQQENLENIPINPATKVSFRGIKCRQQNITPIQLIDSSTAKKDAYLSPIKLGSTRNNGTTRAIDNNKEDCNKFSVLLQSKGYANSGRKKSIQISFRTLNSITKNQNGSRTRLNTERFDTERTVTEAEYKIKGRENKIGNKEEIKFGSKADQIQQKCREIKEKNYFSSRTATGQLNSLNKLKNKLISPLKKKSQSQPEQSRMQQLQQQRQKQKERQKQKQKVINIFEHSSILSEHDLVNVSKTNESLDFDMSPWL